MTRPGKLMIVGTPIGNLSDFPPRGVEALRAADFISARHAPHSKLLNHFASKNLPSRFTSTTKTRRPRPSSTASNGRDDRSRQRRRMPIVSDPGFPLVRERVVAA